MKISKACIKFGMFILSLAIIPFSFFCIFKLVPKSIDEFYNNFNKL